MNQIPNTNKRRNYTVPWYAWHLVSGPHVGLCHLEIHIGHLMDVSILGSLHQTRHRCQCSSGHTRTSCGCQKAWVSVLGYPTDVKNLWMLKYFPQMMFHFQKAHKHFPVCSQAGQGTKLSCKALCLAWVSPPPLPYTVFRE